MVVDWPQVGFTVVHVPFISPPQLLTPGNKAKYLKAGLLVWCTVKLVHVIGTKLA